MDRIIKEAPFKINGKVSQWGWDRIAEANIPSEDQLTFLCEIGKDFQNPEHVKAVVARYSNGIPE